MALKEINRGPVVYTGLYFEVMAIVADGYSEDVQNKKVAQGFLAKNTKLRKLWMDSFLFTHF